MADVKGTPARQSRRERAQSTRRRIVEAAYQRFTEQGYAATTMDSVAGDAGVAVQTVYFTFRTKGELLQAAYEHAVDGPDGVPPHLSSWWQAAEAAPEVSTAVRLFVDGTMSVFERAAPLVWAVLGDENARPGYEYNDGLRRAGYERAIAFLARKHDLRPGLTSLRARDILLVVLGPQIFSQFTRDLGWTNQEVADWAADVLLEQLFGIDA
ncbi:TetR/AcrR family transcriptional regulator [Kribbella kalugense]|uniref:TetR family transcriptional regulator n=1 Tax=Kribbella kalugense TaxID=2512221 RepID=A0A4R7ZE92_9ACTN|nr:TetR/AcrR family transcriptional regulator [Kribbella kalugense]TDW15385.1 TetR family transcriptional regulator [Kribbella kalugense]